MNDSPLIICIKPDDPPSDKQAKLAQAAAILQDGGLVAFPTETVYGLGANALDADAVSSIFRAKGRPSTDPLIVHIAELAAARELSSDWPALAEQLAQAFWPGPLSLIVARSEAIPEAVSAGLDSVALRMPDHPVALALIRAADRPLAAPSANPFGGISPTRAEHVLAGLGSNVDAIVDAGPTRVGIESTVVDCRGSIAKILRPGGVPAEAIMEVLGTERVALSNPPGTGGNAIDGSEDERGSGGEVRSRGDSWRDDRLDGPRQSTSLQHPLPTAQRSPGTALRHYAPKAPLTLFSFADDRALIKALRTAIQEFLEPDAGISDSRRLGLLLASEDLAELHDLIVDHPRLVVEVLASRGDLSTAARGLYAGLHALDAAGLERIYARDFGTSTPSGNSRSTQSPQHLIAGPDVQRETPPQASRRGIESALHDRLWRAAEGRVVS